MKTSLLLLIFLPFLIFAQTDSTKYILIESLTQKINAVYLDVVKAKAMSDTVKYKMTAERYDSTLNQDEFAYEVTKDLRRVSGDNHIIVSPPHFRDDSYDFFDSSPYTIKQLNRRRKKRSEKFVKFLNEYRKRTRNDMFRYGDIKILPGNIGYVEIKEFSTTSYYKKLNRDRISFRSVLDFLAKTNSIIVDFRENIGGKIFLSAKFCSYFSDTPNAYFITTVDVSRYDSGGVMNEIEYKEKLYTDPLISNSLVGNKKVLVLTSKRTFSAGELSAYKLRQLNRNTTIIGENTSGGGGAYFGSVEGKYFTAWIPSVRVFDENNSNYTIDGKGIKPDIETSADSALAVAYRFSLNGNKDTIISKSWYFKKQKLIPDLKGDIFKKKYGDYVGDYRKIVITKENEKLYMTYDLYEKHNLIPGADDFFLTDGYEFIRFMRNKESNVTEIQVKHKDGYLEKFRRQ